MSFDGYWDPDDFRWESSSSDSSFQIYKLGGALRFNYGAAAPGAALGWNNGILMASSGTIGIGVDDPTVSVTVAEGMLVNQKNDAALDDSPSAAELRPVALRFGGDASETGIFSNRASGSINRFGLSFVTQGATRMVIENSGIATGGNVGIGTSNPSERLQVAGGSIRPQLGSGDDNGINFPPDSGGDDADRAYIRYFVVSGEDTELRIGIENESNDILMFDQQSGIYNSLVIKDRKVWIRGNLADPVALLQVDNGAIRPTAGSGAADGVVWPPDPGGGSGDTGFLRYFSEDGTENTQFVIGTANDAADRISLFQFGGERLIIHNARVGIEDPNPDATLDVEGTLRANFEHHNCAWVDGESRDEAANPKAECPDGKFMAAFKHPSSGPERSRAYCCGGP